MPSISADSPFSTQNPQGYANWREHKLANHPATLEDIIVPVADPFALTDAENQQLQDCIERCNMAIYQVTGPMANSADKAILAEIGRHFGLEQLDHNLYADDDAISSLTITAHKGGKGYIPYTNRPIAWHTDGYYNSGDRQIRAMLLHCVRPAVDGGTNHLLDHEMAYLMLRDENPAYIDALCHPQAMSIPPNNTDGQEIRGEVTGPVFSLDIDGHLHMRYTARTRSIQWLEDPLVLEARDALQEILKQPSPWHFQGKLQSGQGLLCNNVLHTRTGFEENSDRLMYRGRYFDRIATRH